MIITKKQVDKFIKQNLIKQSEGYIEYINRLSLICPYDVDFF